MVLKANLLHIKQSHNYSSLIVQVDGQRCIFSGSLQPNNSFCRSSSTVAMVTEDPGLLRSRAAEHEGSVDLMIRLEHMTVIS